MTPTTVQSGSRLLVLQELLGGATHEASTAMSRWTNGLISLSLDEVLEVPLDEVHEHISLGDDLLTMVVLHVEGDVGGQFLLAFDDANGRQLAACLLGREPSTDGEWTELEKSALNETGNILGCAYMNALTRLIGVELVPSPPFFVQDFGASVLDQALAMQAMTCDQALICRTGFRRQDQDLNWHVFFTPTQPMRDLMERAIGAHG